MNGNNYPFLKTLRLKGFKSFANTTTIHFSPGITAIVGPNGCGKSNLVDAIKWVLGEQGFKSLRSKSNEDLIFNGTDRHPSVNMAEVSIVLEGNSEVMISRRIFRSGEGEYFLNKKPCRLKDIKETLLNFGFGLKNYAIIDQGQVAHILEFSPIEKRRLLEEAAGVTKYRAKKEETLKKIEETRQNLLRLKDILNEVERQVKKLHIQAKKAKEYLKTKEDLYKVNVSLLLKRYKAKYNTLIEVKNKIAKLKEEKRVLKEKIDYFSKEKSSFEKELNVLEEELKRKEENFWEIKTEIKQLEVFFNNFEQQKHNFENQKESLERQKKLLLKDSEDIEKQLQEILKEREDLEKLISSAEKTKQMLEEEINDLIENLKKEHFILKQKITTLGYLKEKIIKFNIELKHIYRQKILKEEELKKSKEKLNKLEGQKRKSSQILEKISNQIKILNKKLETIEEEHKKLQNFYEKAIEKKQRWQKAILRLEEAAIKFKSRLKNAKSWLNNYQSASPPEKDMKAAIDIINDAHGLEDAVEAVLRLKASNGWLINDLSRALEIKNRHSETHFSLILLSPFKISFSLPKIGIPLLNCIEIKKDYLLAAHRLFGNVILVNEFSKTLLNYSNLIFVTPKGDILTTEGILHKGFSQGTLKEYLFQKRICDFLEKAIKAIENKLFYLREKLKRLKENIKHSNETLKQIKIEIENISWQKRKLKEEEIKQNEFLKYASLQKEEIEKKIIEYTEELKHYEIEIKDKQNFLEEKKKELKDLEEEISLLKERIREIEITKQKKEKDLNKFLWEVNTGEKRLKKLIKEKQRLEQKKEKLFFQQKECEKGLSEIKKQMSFLINEYEIKKKEFNNYQSEEKDINVLIKELKEKKEGILKQIETVNERIKRCQINMQKLIEEIKNYELSNSKLAGEIDVLKERLNKEYNLSETTSPPIDLLEAELEEKKVFLEQCLLKMEGVNLGAIDEYEEIKERYEFLKNQERDLKTSLHDLEKAIKTIDKTSLNLFSSTLNEVNQKFCSLLKSIFGEAKGEIFFTEPNHPLSSGIDFKVKLPGKRVTHHLLSMGERCLISLIFLFSLYFVKPSPFCILDEVDAGLDERNLKYLCKLFLKLKEQMQLIIITHKRATMEIANQLIGITMEEKGISRVLSISLEEKRDVKVV